VRVSAFFQVLYLAISLAEEWSVRGMLWQVKKSIDAIAVCGEDLPLRLC